MAEDITKTELAAALPAGDVKTWLEAASDLPTNVPMTELLATLIKACNTAATTKNTTLATGQKIGSYPNTIFSSVTSKTDGSSVVYGQYIVIAELPLALTSATSFQG